MHLPFDSSNSLLGIYFCRYSSTAPKCSTYKVINLTLFEIVNNNTTKLQYTHSIEYYTTGTSLVVQWLGCHPFIEGVTGSITGWTKIPQAV